MGRKFKNGDQLKAGGIYGYNYTDNTFKVIHRYGLCVWVEWEDNLELEVLELDQDTLDYIIILD